MKKSLILSLIILFSCGFLFSQDLDSTLKNILPAGKIPPLTPYLENSSYKLYLPKKIDSLPSLLIIINQTETDYISAETNALLTQKVKEGKAIVYIQTSKNDTKKFQSDFQKALTDVYFNKNSSVCSQENLTIICNNQAKQKKLNQILRKNKLNITADLSYLL